jgi:hypothetical protein
MKKLALTLSILALSACSTTKAVSELPSIPTDATPQEAVNYISATCAGFAKAGSENENEHGTELNLFNDCMNKAVEMIENSTEPTTEE